MTFNFMLIGGNSKNWLLPPAQFKANLMPKYASRFFSDLGRARLSRTDEA